jgi:uncharacterized protein YggE
MKKLIFLAALLVAGTAAAQQVPIEGGVNLSYSYENAVQVNGKAERKVTPDEIYVAILIREAELKGKKSVEKAESDMIAALKKLGVDTEKNLTLDRMSSDYKDYFLRYGQGRTSATYELKVSSAQELGRAYQALEEAGISNMRVTRQTHSKLREIQSELRIEAMKDAQRIATDLVGAVGQKLGPAVYIADYNSGGGVVMTRSMDTAYYAAEKIAPSQVDYETPLQLSDLNLTYNVSVKFALEK